MRAVVVERPGDASVLTLREVPAPALRPRDVRIAVAACGVCFHDVVVRNGTFRMGVAMPLVPGHEVAGIVEAVGPEVREFRPGDRVAATHHRFICGACGCCRGGRETSCPQREFLGDAGLNGGYAELVSIGEENVAAVPGDVALEEAAIVACPIGTELNAIRDVAEVRLGERVLVTGAGGGLGIHGVQLARLAGAHTIAVTTSSAKVEDIRAAGADDVLVVAAGEDFSARVKALTGRGADVAIDNVGSAVFHATRRSLADGGRYVLVGQLTGDLIDINPAQLFLRDISLLSAKGVSRAQLEECLRLVARRRIRPVVSGEFPLDEAGAAHRMVELGRSTGRLLLKPSL